MKKTLLLLICLLLTSYIAADIKVDLGLAAGFGTSWYKDIENSGLEFEAGVFLDMRLSKLFSIQTEFNFIQVRHDGYITGNLITAEKATFTTNLIEIPILGKINIDNFNVYLGFALSVIIGKQKIEFASGSYILNDEDSYEPDIFSLIVGTGYAIHTSDYGKFVFDLRYKNSDTDLKIDSISFRIGYALHIY